MFCGYFNVHYNVAALVISFAIVILYLFIKHVKTKTTVAYMVMLCVNFFACVFGVLFSVMLQVFPQLTALDYALGIMMFLTTFSVCVIYLVFFINLIRKDKKYSKTDKVIVFFPAIIIAFIIAVTPFSKGVFSIENGVYIRGEYTYIVFVTGVLYVGAAVFLSIRHRRSLTKSQNVAVFLYTTIFLCAGFIQYFFMSIQLISFGQSVIMLFLFISMQNDMNDEDKVLGTFNESAMSRYIHYKTQKHNEFYVLAIRFNDFSDLNKLIGFDEANEMLRTVADRIMRITPGKLVFHVKGVRLDCIVFKDEEYMKQYVKKVEQVMQQPIKYDDGMEEIRLSYSAVITKSPMYGKNVEEVSGLIRYTLMHMSNKSEIVWIDEEKYQGYLRKNVVEAAIERGLKNDNFIVYYQPIMNTKDGIIRSAEALVRLDDPEEGMIYPDEFIPIAENNGTIIDIDAIVFNKVCRFISMTKLWEKQIEYIEVNLSPIECMQENLHSKIVEVMDMYSINRNLINLEITETAAVSNNVNANDNIDALVREGLTFSLDDFGTGFSNTTQLIELPFKMIKVDKSILWMAMKENTALSVLKHTISMLHDLYREIIVEGVENEEQVELLTKLGCQHLQGYYYSPPLPEDAFLDYLAKAN